MGDYMYADCIDLKYVNAELTYANDIIDRMRKSVSSRSNANSDIDNRSNKIINNITFAYSKLKFCGYNDINNNTNDIVDKIFDMIKMYDNIIKNWIKTHDSVLDRDILYGFDHMIEKSINKFIIDNKCSIYNSIDFTSGVMCS